MTSNSEGRSLLGKILFVVGVIIILIVLAFLIITFVPRAFSGLANIGSSVSGLFGRNDITVTASSAVVTNGDSVTIQWSTERVSNGSYGITFGCVDDVEIDIATDSGQRTLTCGTPFTLGATANQATLRVFLDVENGFRDVPIQVFFTEAGKNQPTAQGETFITIQNGDPNAGTLGSATITTEPVDTTEEENVVYVETPVTTTQSQAPRPVSTSAPVYQTPADLAISNIATGGSRVAFTVSNVGGTRTNPWIFSYTTPTNQTEVLSSPLQIPLAPGQSIRYTLNFAVKDAGNQTVTIAIDPLNVIPEITKANNIGSIVMTGPAFGTTGGSTGGGYNQDDDADFTIEDIEVGRISGSRFIADNRAYEGDDIAIRFIVRNRGGEATRDWRFEINDTPYDGGDSYRSARYERLQPGAYLEVTVQFDNIDEGRYDIEVVVDADDDTDEERESNNTRTVRLTVDR